MHTDRPPEPVPPGFDVPPLPDETAAPANADQHGRSWWRAYKKAEELQHPQEEVERFKGLARDWFHVRDARVKAEQLSSVTSTAKNVDLDQVIRDVESGKDIGDQPGYFLGRPMSDWLRHVEEL